MPKPKVTAVDLIATPAGKLQGFPTLRGVDLNVTGIHNDTTTTFACVLVVQVKFTLAAGSDSTDVDVGRMVLRLASVRGDDGSRVPSNKTAADGGRTGDGPSPQTIIRPSATMVAVSDSPGYPGGQKERFPVIYHASYDLYAWDNTTTNGAGALKNEKGVLAQVSYVVDFQKQTSTDAAPTFQPLHVVTKIWP